MKVQIAKPADWTNAEMVKQQKKWNWANSAYHLMMLPGMIFLIIFSYIPMFGIIMAFQDYIPAKGVLGSEFVGMEHFIYLFQLPDIGLVFKNTMVIAFGKILLGTFAAIVFSILLNEIRLKLLKKSIQTVVYLPHFLSWVVLAAVVVNMFSLDGTVNQILNFFGIEKLNFLGSNSLFQPLLIGTDVW
jgi:putative aldouronate transport system permease protein